MTRNAEGSHRLLETLSSAACIVLYTALVLRARVLENAELVLALDADQQRRVLIDRAIRRGRIDIADAVRALNPGDAAGA